MLTGLPERNKNNLNPPIILTRCFVPLITQNSDLKRHGIFTFTLPAHRFTHDGKTFTTCPSAGACATVCYAKNGTYLFGKVKAKHIGNYFASLQESFVEDISAEISRKAMSFFRIHDAGDFYSVSYLKKWYSIAEAFPSILFYAYRKEVTMAKKIPPPKNFIFILSYGGKHDHLIEATDRRADVFENLGAIHAAGFSYVDNDSEAATGHIRVGLLQNNIPRFKNLLKSRTFSDFQRES